MSGLRRISRRKGPEAIRAFFAFEIIGAQIEELTIDYRKVLGRPGAPRKQG